MLFATKTRYLFGMFKSCKAKRYETLLNLSIFSVVKSCFGKIVLCKLYVVAVVIIIKELNE